jgi:hypothetical protein
MATPKTHTELADCIGSAIGSYLRPMNKRYEITYVQASANLHEETDEPYVTQRFMRVICKLVETFTHDLESVYGHLDQEDRIPSILIDQLGIHCEIDSANLGLIERHIVRTRPYFLSHDASSSVVFVSCTRIA